MLTKAQRVYVCVLIRTLATSTCLVGGAKLSNLRCGYTLASFALHYISSIRRRKLEFVSLPNKE